MDIARLSTDSIEINHHTDTDGTAECVLAFRSFRDERTTDGPLEHLIPETDMRTAPCGTPEIATYYEIDLVNDAAGTNVAAANSEAALTKGITLSGFSPDDVLTVTQPPGRLFVSAYNTTFGGRWAHRTNVIFDGDPAEGTVLWNGLGYGSAEGARLNFGVHTLTGHESYTFYIGDNYWLDNAGGLSLQIDVNI
jgi:hypothetical protein